MSAPVIVPEEGEFRGDYMDAREMAGVGRELIAEYEELEHLRSRTIAYLWKAKGGGSGGQDTLGQAALPSKLVKHFKDVDYIVWFAADHVRDRLPLWSQHEIEALVYHELCHCDFEVSDKGVMKLIIKPHDFAGFGNELRRFGRWNSGLESMHQATLPGVA